MKKREAPRYRCRRLSSWLPRRSRPSRMVSARPRSRGGRRLASGPLGVIQPPRAAPAEHQPTPSLLASQVAHAAKVTSPPHFLGVQLGVQCGGPRRRLEPSLGTQSARGPRSKIGDDRRNSGQNSPSRVGGRVPGRSPGALLQIEQQPVVALDLPSLTAHQFGGGQVRRQRRAVMPGVVQGLRGRPEDVGPQSLSRTVRRALWTARPPL